MIKTVKKRASVDPENEIVLEDSYIVNSIGALEKIEQNYQLSKSISDESVEVEEVYNIPLSAENKIKHDNENHINSEGSLKDTVIQNSFDNEGNINKMKNNVAELSRKKNSEKNGINFSNIIDLLRIRKDSCNLKELPYEDAAEKPHIRYLSYMHNEIDIIPCLITKFSCLQELKLDFNRIKIIPSFIHHLKHISVLSLSFNLIEKIPIELSRLKSLKQFIINNNKISKFSKHLCNLPLQILMLHGNKINKVPYQFSNLNKLLELGLDWFYYVAPYTSKIVKEKESKDFFDNFFNLLEIFKVKRKKCDFINFLNHFYNTDFNKIKNVSIFGRKRCFLHKACFQGNDGIVDLLIKNNCEINSIDENQCTPLLISIRSNNFSISKRLLECSNCDPNIYSRKYGIPFHFAIIKQKFELALFILENFKIDINHTDNEGNNPLHLIFMQYSEYNPIIENLLNMLITKGIDTNKLNYNLLSPLYLALKKNQREAIKFVFKINENFPNKFIFNYKCGKYEWTSLHYSVIYSEIDILLLILKTNVDIFETDNIGRTARDLALVNSVQTKIIIGEEKKNLRKKYAKQLYKRKIKRIMNLPLKQYKNFSSKKVLNDELSEGENEAGQKLKEYSENRPFEYDQMSNMNKRRSNNNLNKSPVIKLSIKKFNFNLTPLNASGPKYFSNFKFDSKVEERLKNNIIQSQKDESTSYSSREVDYAVQKITPFLSTATHELKNKLKYCNSPTNIHSIFNVNTKRSDSLSQFTELLKNGGNTDMQLHLAISRIYFLLLKNKKNLKEILKLIVKKCMNPTIKHIAVYLLQLKFNYLYRFPFPTRASKNSLSVRKTIDFNHNLSKDSQNNESSSSKNVKVYVIPSK